MPDPTLTDRPALLTAAQVAEMAQCDESTVRRWANSGLLPAIRLPGATGYGRIRFRAADVEAMLARPVAS